MAHGEVGSMDDLSAMLQRSEPVRRYMARAFVDDSPAAAVLFDEFVNLSEQWLGEGEREGWVRHTDDPRARATIYVAWLLAPMTLERHVARALGLHDPHDRSELMRYLLPAMDMLTHGVFTDDRWMDEWRKVQ